MSGPEPTARRGLVIGAGAALGGAWAVGALCALADVEGYDATAADVVVGTSAGSLLAAMIGLAVPPQAMAFRLSGPPEDVEGTEPVNPFDVPDHVHRALTGIPRPIPLPGNLLLAARTVGRPDRHTAMTAAAALAPRGRGNLAPIGELVEEYGGRSWPDRPRTWVVAMDFDSGRRVVFGRAGAPEASLPEAVMASCAAPGYFPPAVVGGRRYVDGGAVSVTNVDVLLREHLDEVLVLAPMVAYEPDHPRSPAAILERRLRRHLTRRLDGEVGRLAATGTRVRVLAPGAEDLAVIGANVMDARRRRIVFETARRTTTERLTAPPADAAPGPLGRAG